MGKHFSPTELDNIQAWKSECLSPVQIHARLMRDRKRSKKQGPDLTTVRRFLNGKSHKRSSVETRGRKRSLSDANLNAMNRVRKKLIKQVDGDREITWAEVIAKARVPAVDPSTVAKHMKHKFDVKARAPRLKPMRSELDKADRKDKCSRLRKRSLKYWVDGVHLYMDNKKWPFPRSVRGKRFAKKLRVRRHLRTRAEGLQPGFTKPDKRKHRVNLGCLNLCAGIIKGKVRVWHYLDNGWGGEAAKELYEKVIGPALTRHHGMKRQYNILEDNDPTAYKSNAAKEAKRNLKIVPIEFPTYSPELNPCDYALWEEVENRMAAQKAPKHESVSDFKARLRRTAMAIPKPVIEKMLGSMVRRTQGIFDNDGGHIPRD